MIWRWSAHSKFINHVPLSRGFAGVNRPSSPTSKGRDNSSNRHTHDMTRGSPYSRTQAVWPGSKSGGVFFLRCGTIFAGSGFPGTPRGPNCLAACRPRTASAAHHQLVGEFLCFHHRFADWFSGHGQGFDLVALPSAYPFAVSFGNAFGSMSSTPRNTRRFWHRRHDPES
jgi:hypothetical protein